MPFAAVVFQMCKRGRDSDEAVIRWNRSSLGREEVTCTLQSSEIRIVLIRGMEKAAELEFKVAALGVGLGEFRRFFEWSS